MKFVFLFLTSLYMTAQCQKETNNTIEKWAEEHIYFLREQFDEWWNQLD